MSEIWTYFLFVWTLARTTRFGFWFFVLNIVCSVDVDKYLLVFSSSSSCLLLLRSLSTAMKTVALLSLAALVQGTGLVGPRCLQLREYTGY